MSSEWGSATVGSVCTLVTKGTTPTTLGYKFSSSGVKFIKVESLSDDGRILEDKFAYISNEAHLALSRSRLETDDVLFSIAGTIGRTAIVRSEYLPANTNQALAILRPNVDLVEPRFLRYALANPYLTRSALAKTVESVQANFSLGELKKITLKLPSKSDQRTVLSILNPLDDRISLLCETNKTLEAIAQAIFKSWFVDFDPVRAKMEGRQPEGMDEETAALFPDSFEESELGLIPKGWQIKCVGDVIQTLGGATPNTKNLSFWEPEEFYWTTPKDLSGASAPVLLNTERRISATGLSKISSGLLPIGTLLLSSRAPIGYLSLTQIPVAVNQGYIAMPPGGVLSPIFMYFWCNINMDIIKGHANGSTFMEISKKAFRPISIVTPPSDIVHAFTEIAEMLFDTISTNALLAENLSALRDTLLPRLISGQLRLPEAQALVEENDP